MTRNFGTQTVIGGVSYTAWPTDGDIYPDGWVDWDMEKSWIGDGGSANIGWPIDYTQI